jgi:hypothetical protein
MTRYLYKAWNENEGQVVRYFAIHVKAADDRWVSTCEEINADGSERPDAPAVAPKFYGITAEQAHRRMRDILENTYDRVEPMPGPPEDRT